MTNRSKIGAGLLAVAAAVVLFVVLNGGSDSNNDTTTTGSGAASIPVIHLRNGDPVGGQQELTATSSGAVRFEVTSDIPGEVHVHGYDYEKPIKAGGSVSFDFPAKLEGAFEVELHHGGGENTIAELKVEPG
jgi:hypothetical protein